MSWHRILNEESQFRIAVFSFLSLLHYSWSRAGQSQAQLASFLNLAAQGNETFTTALLFLFF